MKAAPREPLPIDSVLPQIAAALRDGRNLVLTAAPGAGKTTRVPLALLTEPWLAGRKIVMQEPRRLATRAAARRMAATLGEEVGETVGYRVRLDTNVGSRTRIEVVTDGILLRLIQNDPGLEGIGLLIFDEFHERGLDSDLGLALARDIQLGLRDDLRLLVMSATLDASPVAELLGQAEVIVSEGRAFPVEVRYQPPNANEGIEVAMARTIRAALGSEPGSILGFLPGAAEIRRTATLLDAADLGENILIAPLYGDLSPGDQDRAIQPPPAGKRKIVLATAIAETSLTIEGVRVVVDSGQMRLPRFDPASGMSRLVTQRVSADTAEQRRGRAGRLSPGVCFRLWSEPQQRALLPKRPPEIINADLAGFALELAAWGAAPSSLAWLDPPPAALWAQARSLLVSTGGLDAEGHITPHGREMIRLGLHPRLAHMLLRARELDLGATAAAVAALLEERDPFRNQNGCDLRDRLDMFGRDEVGFPADRAAIRRIKASARDYRRRLGVSDAHSRSSAVGLLIAFAYPDRISQRRSGGGFRLAIGRGAVLPATDPLARSDFLAIADLDGERENARIFRAAPLERSEIETYFADLVTVADEIYWNERDGAVVARRVRRLGAVVLEEASLQRPSPQGVRDCLLGGIRSAGLQCLPWTAEATTWRQRIIFMHRLDAENWPDLSDQALLGSLGEWLGPYLDGMSRLAHLGRLDLLAILKAQLDWAGQRRLDELAPSHLEVPSGSRVPIDYAAVDEPVLAVRLQEMFGLATTPRIVDGKVPLLLHLLSPARRPVQVTRDLASFWANGYAAVRSDLRGRYPKHFWPEDPMQAEPTSRVRPRRL